MLFWGRAHPKEKQLGVESKFITKGTVETRKEKVQIKVRDRVKKA